MNSPKAWPLAAAVVVAGFGATLAINWPGHLSYDSLLQLQQGRAGLYNTWHPPVMAWLLGLGDAVIPGTGLYILFQSLLAFGSLGMLVQLSGRRSGWAVAVAAATVALPQLLLYQGLVWKDVLFADAAVAGFAGLAWAVSTTGRPRLVLAALSFLLLLLAALTRQNGFVLLPFASAVWGWTLFKAGRTPLHAACAGLAALAALLVCTAAAGALLNLRSDGNPGQREQITLLKVYDLAGLLQRDPALSLPELTSHDPAFAGLLRRDGARLYTPVRNDPLAAVLSSALAEVDPDVIDRSWRDAVLDHPALYLRVRAADFWWVFATPDIAACRPVFTGIDGPQGSLTSLGISARRDARDLALKGYGVALFGTPVWSHLAFAGLAIMCLILLLRRRRAADVVLAALVLGVLVFSASFFFIAIACDYRYLYPLDLSALAVLLYLSTDFKSAIRGTP